MATMKFLCDTKRCIECNGCTVACKSKNDTALEWGISRRRVVTMHDGVVGKEVSISVACMHCSDAPCMAVCPADCFEQTAEGIIRHSKDKCIGCGYCLYACPFGAPQFPKKAAFAGKGKMDKCTYCAGGPDAEVGSEKEARLYGANRIAEGKLPFCAEVCATKALLSGDSEVISGIFRERVAVRGAKDAGWAG
ncbi:formate dehydrogenase FDH3 subunit beta [Ferrimonas marina]|uniref:Formate dehydrogenase iron-sulfur subunit n=1 Tax=Ferrimonas marina TaxID=299255 RepID=A0A1M5XVW9_9GAMM|nr:formate dehydrogenase FDH3 subunit beta [Ferrimonas marina]SHI03977.1 formate dehydrogenase iron-sulfur subunit [Ferrimonas marina]